MEKLTVAVEDDHLETIEEVAGALARKGMVVDSILSAAGLILGSADVDPADLASVDGVASVEGPNEFQLPSPDSPVQ